MSPTIGRQAQQRMRLIFSPWIIYTNISHLVRYRTTTSPGHAHRLGRHTSRSKRHTASINGSCNLRMRGESTLRTNPSSGEVDQLACGVSIVSHRIQRSGRFSWNFSHRLDTRICYGAMRWDAIWCGPSCRHISPAAIKIWITRAVPSFEPLTEGAHSDSAGSAQGKGKPHWTLYHSLLIGLQLEAYHPIHRHWET